MSLDFYLEKTQPVHVFEANITHNLNRMAEEAGIYMHLWRPEELEGVTCAADLIEPLQKGLDLLLSDPDRFEKFNASNGWGTYDHFLTFVTECLVACQIYPDAKPVVSR